MDEAATSAEVGIRKDLLDVQQLANEFGISTRTIARWWAGRTGPARVKIGRKIFFRRQAILEFLERQEQKPVRSRRA